MIAIEVSEQPNKTGRATTISENVEDVFDVSKTFPATSAQYLTPNFFPLVARQPAAGHKVKVCVCSMCVYVCM